MKRQDFSYNLPDELIARAPPTRRRDSRLLRLDGASGALTHAHFPDLLNWLEAGDALIFNDTRVIPARLFGRKASGGKLEILVERVLGDRDVLAQVRASKSLKPASQVYLDDETALEVVGRVGEFVHLRFPAAETAFAVMARVGKVPLPPYIDREPEAADLERYQTVFARHQGAVAAPTAGLHFDQELLDQLQARGVKLGFVTLHVGAGTFQPMRVDDLREHTMHKEVMTVGLELCDLVRATKAAGKRVVAVGTTSVRCLETAARAGEIAPFQGETDIFIYPPYDFRVVDALITNFHLPESTLIMLVSAFAGYRETMAAYQAAVAERYRFFSYGDAMFISRNPNPQLPANLSITSET